MTITNEDERKAQGLMKELQDVLAERLLLSRSWHTVSTKRRKTYIEIKWYDSKIYDDPTGKFSFKLDRVSPLSLSALENAVTRQKEKLTIDKMNDARREKLG